MVAAPDPSPSTRLTSVEPAELLPPQPAGDHEQRLLEELHRRVPALLSPPARDRQAVGLADRLRLEHGVDPGLIARAEASIAGAAVINPLVNPPNPELISRLGPGLCARHGILPWRNNGGTITILTCRPEHFVRHLSLLNRTFGHVRMAIATEALLTEALQRAFGPTLAQDAETRAPTQQSCRSWSRLRPGALGLVLAMSFLAVALLAPLVLFAVLLALAFLSATAFGLLRAVTGILSLWPPRRDGDILLHHLPTISLLVPLFEEDRIAAHLLQHLGRLDYPRASLDLILILEEGDATTAATLTDAKLPPWIRVVTVPRGQVQTKPRALNYALEFCRGSIVGIYDAEDAPASDQLRCVAKAFATAGKDVACLQGCLDFYNAQSNWLTRCFTLEYATWFRIILPGLARLGLPVPLGGTTLFFRRAALEKLGAWDAHNVTEDADLGLRLARAGYRTELIPTVTQEEATSRFVPWVRQRSRWLKGYALTYGVHMRRPRSLWQDVGPFGFLGVQVIFLGSFLQVFLAPVLWSFWLLLFGLPNPLDPLIPPGILSAMGLTLIALEVTMIAVGVQAARIAGHRDLMVFVPTLHVYFPLAMIAAIKAVWELFFRPFYWDKTSHGLFLTDPPEQPRPLQHLA